MRCHSAIILGLLTGIGIADSASAVVWRVERDGSGDFTTIQPAIDVASSGDVIEIGPGRYPEFIETENGWLACAIVKTDNLTIRGVDRDLVVLGPDTGPFAFRTTGITGGPPSLVVESLTVENVEDGISAAGNSTVVRNCRISSCDIGINSVSLLQTLVEDGIFVGNACRGVIVFDALGSVGVEIRRSVFRENLGGIDLQTSDNVVENCEFYDNVVGLQFSSAATGVAQSCYFENNETAIGLLSTSTIVLDRTTVAGGAVNLFLSNGSYAEGTKNIFRGGSFATIRLTAQSNMNLSGCHILSGGYPWRVKAQSSGAPIQIDLRNNYWGTSDAAEIAQSILDSNDAETITATVLFEPFSDEPISTEATSFSILKARFGPHED